MGFGKGAKKVKKHEAKHSENVGKEIKKVVGKNSRVDSSVNNINSNDNISNISLKQQRASSFLNKASKNKGSNILLFGQTKEEKLEQFIYNSKLLHPNKPDFWLKNEINKFKKKFDIES